MKILFLSRWFPYPPDNGAKIRIFNLIKQLSSNHQIDLISFATEVISESRLSGMKAYCGEIASVIYHPFQPNSIRSYMGYFSPKPRSIIDTFNLEYQKYVDTFTTKTHYDLLIASEIDTIPYGLKPPVSKKIFEELEILVPYDSYQGSVNLFHRMRNWLTWWKLTKYLRESMLFFDGCTVVSEPERKVAEEIFSGRHRVEVIPNGVDLSQYLDVCEVPVEDTLIYSGSLTYSANFDAMEFFLGEIFTRIRAQRPNAHLFITGRTDGVNLDRLPKLDGVTYTGYLQDIRPLLARSWLSVVPLRVGGGTRLKILESLALGTPVVSTRKGMEGLDLIPGEHLLVEDDPQGFAEAVIRILADPQIRSTIGENGREVVKAHYDWQKIGRQFNQFIQTVVN